jgi:hexosaminidase
MLSAATTVGVLRGLETFLQLLEGDRGGYFIPLASIQDKPRFPWRGLLIDVCRHWQPIEVIKRNLDGMAAVKLNVLHLHLTENQGFRVESRKYPKLQEMGSDGLYYTQDQIREIIAYARDRGIRVVPEFDIPGHSTAWFVGYPELASAPGPIKSKDTTVSLIRR